MKNTTRTTPNKAAKEFSGMTNLFNFQQLKHTSRQFLSSFFIFALVFVPLLTMDGAIRKAQAQITFCEGAENILQGCPLGNNGTETALTNQAIDDVIALYELPQSERALML